MTFDMKTILSIMSFLLFYPMLLQAQYTGGDGRGDAFAEILAVPVAIAGPGNNDFIYPVLLYQNYPNPFSETTSIELCVIKKTRITVVISDALGREVQATVTEPIQSGRHTLMFDGSALSPGVYVCKITTEGLSQSMRMILAK